MDQIDRDRRGQFSLAHQNGTSQEVQDGHGQLRNEYTTAEEDQTGEFEAAWGDVTGAELDPAGAKQARKEEVDYIRKMKVDTTAHES